MCRLARARGACVTAAPVKQGHQGEEGSKGISVLHAFRPLVGRAECTWGARWEPSRVMEARAAPSSASVLGGSCSRTWAACAQAAGRHAAHP